MPAILDQFATYTLVGDPRHLTQIQDVGNVVPTPVQDPPTDDRVVMALVVLSKCCKTSAEISARWPGSDSRFNNVIQMACC